MEEDDGGRTWCGATFRLWRRTSCGWRMRPAFRRWRGFCSSRWSNAPIGWARNCIPPRAGGARRRRAVIHHSDRGSQFTSIAFGNRCRDAGVRLSMGSTGDCYDNALCESFLRHAGVRIDRSRDVPHAARGRVGDLRFHRGVLQQQAPPLAHRLPEPGGVRAPGRLGPHAGGGVNVAPADPRELWSAARRPGRVGRPALLRPHQTASLRIGEPPRSRAAGPQGLICSSDKLSTEAGQVHF